MYSIFAAFIVGAVLGWLFSINHIRALKQQLDVYQYYVHNRIGQDAQRVLGLKMHRSSLPPD